MNTETHKTIIVFDFDFTIAKTIEHIWVWSPRGNLLHEDKTYRKVHPTQLQQQDIGTDEHVNEDSFKEFYSLNIEKTKIIEPIFTYLKYYTSIQNVYILTARPQSVQTEIFSFLEKHNIDTNKIVFIGMCNSSFHKKIEWLKDEIQTNNYKKIIIFEDNKKLIDYIINSRCIDIEYGLYYISNFYDRTVITYYE